VGVLDCRVEGSVLVVAAEDGCLEDGDRIPVVTTVDQASG